MSSGTSADCGLPSFGLDTLPTSSASVLISLRGLNGTRPSHCPRLLKLHFQLFMHRKAQGRWQGLISGLLPRELPGVRCSDNHGCVFRACFFSDTSNSVFQRRSASDPHCTQPSSVLVTPPPELPSPQPHLAARLELVVSPPFASPMPTAARAWAKQLSIQVGFADFRLLAVEVSSTGEGRVRSAPAASFLCRVSCEAHAHLLGAATGAFVLLDVLPVKVELVSNPTKRLAPLEDVLQAIARLLHSPTGLEANGHRINSRVGAWRQASSPTELSSQLASLLPLPAVKQVADMSLPASTGREVDALFTSLGMCGPSVCPVPWIVVPIALVLVALAYRMRGTLLGEHGLLRRTHRRLHERTGAAGGRWEDLDIISQISYNLNVY